MTAEQDLIDRLRALGAQPVDPHIAAAHASLMASVQPRSRIGRTRAMVAGGTLAAALFTGSGMAAAAGTLPDPVQNAAHATLKKVGVKVPKGTPVACEDAVNHGQYVRSQPKGGAARSAAAKSNCGKKPKPAGETETETETDADGEAKRGRKADPAAKDSGMGRAKDAVDAAGKAVKGRPAEKPVPPGKAKQQQQPASPKP